MNVCIYVCMYRCIDVCMYTYLCTHAYMYVCMYVLIYVCKHACMHVCILADVQPLRVQDGAMSEDEYYAMHREAEQVEILKSQLHLNLLY